MSAFLSLIARFRSDERGVFAMIFGLMAVVLVALGGAAVDFVSFEQARSRAQAAIDSAALGLQPQLFVTPAVPAATLRAKAEELLLERLKASGNWGKCTVATGSAGCVQVTGATIDYTENAIKLDASMSMPTIFVRLVGVNTLSAQVSSEAKRKKIKLEVAFVLDNSFSMYSSSGPTTTRMNELIKATKCAANVLLNGDCDSTASATTVDDTKLGIVPFTWAVNVGPANANQSWINRGVGGPGDLSGLNFDDDMNDKTPFTKGVDRIALFEQMKNMKWGGCVETRQPPYDTNDVPPKTGNPATLFVPLFAPDEPGHAGAPKLGPDGKDFLTTGFFNSYLEDDPLGCRVVPRCVITEVKTGCSTKGTDQSSFNQSCATGSIDVATYSETGEKAAVTSCPAILYNNTRPPLPEIVWSSVAESATKHTNTQVTTYKYDYSDREWQESLCKYKGATASAIQQNEAKGPNTDCPVNPITPLTNSKPKIKTAIEALKPQGFTNVHEGAAWGFRVLSPTLPFTEGDAYNEKTRKVIIMMTDGDNQSRQNVSINGAPNYLAYGYPSNGRLGPVIPSYRTEMDRRTVESCKNAKAEGIIIYTIGLGVQNKQMLRDCSSGKGYWFEPEKAEELTELFRRIAIELSELRLSQ